MATKLTQAQVLAKLGITSKDYSKLDGNGKLQQYLNQEAALKGLPAPFAPSAISALTQDLIPFAGIAAAGALPEAGAADATAGGAGAGGAAGAASSGLSTLAKDAGAGAVLSTLLSGGYFKYAAIWGGLFVLALVLVVKGLGVSTPSPTKIVPVPA